MKAACTTGVVQSNSAEGSLRHDSPGTVKPYRSQAQALPQEGSLSGVKTRN